MLGFLKADRHVFVLERLARREAGRLPLGVFRPEPTVLGGRPESGGRALPSAPSSTDAPLPILEGSSYTILMSQIPEIRKSWNQ